MHDSVLSTVTRRVNLVVTAAEIAHRFSQAAAHWCWLDGEPESAPGTARDVTARNRSYLGIASEVITAIPGREAEFLALMRGTSGSRRAGAFTSGWVVALGYEFGVALLGLSPLRDTAPPAFALRLDVVLAIDHEAGTAELRAGSDADIDAWLDHYGHLLRPEPDTEPESEAEPELQPQLEAASGSLRTGATWRHTDDQYLARIEACRRAIRDGDAYVLCLTDTASRTEVSVSPLELYGRSRSQGRATRGGVIVTRGRALVSASPEQFLSVIHTDAARCLSTHPIKGTRPRGATPDHDQALAAELASDPKERAENLMIVDLLRNDFSRVCDPASIEVHGFLRVESHPHVHQLVSTVTGALRSDIDSFAAIIACFPGGSMTGTPKQRAIEVLQALEAGPRGLYSGCFGWIDDGGEAELAMTIRSIELRHDASIGTSTARVGAGGGITSDSVAQLELAEKHLKAGSLLAVLETPRSSP